jgi:hypothetical protein
LTGLNWLKTGSSGGSCEFCVWLSSYIHTYLRTHGAEPFLRSRQLYSPSRTSQHFMASRHGPRTENTAAIVAWRRPHRKHVSRVRLRVHWSVTSTGCNADGIENTASSIVACWTMITELLPGNALNKSVTILCILSI